MIYQDKIYFQEIESQQVNSFKFKSLFTSIFLNTISSFTGSFTCRKSFFKFYFIGTTIFRNELTRTFTNTFYEFSFMFVTSFYINTTPLFVEETDVNLKPDS